MDSAKLKTASSPSASGGNNNNNNNNNNNSNSNNNNNNNNINGSGGGAAQVTTQDHIAGSVKAKPQDDKSEKPLGTVSGLPAVASSQNSASKSANTAATPAPAAGVVVLNLPPPTASATATGSASASASASVSVSIQANAEITEQSTEPIIAVAGAAASAGGAAGASDLDSAVSTLEPTCAETASMRPNNNTCDFDSDTELSIVAAAAAAVSASSAIIVSSSRSPPTSPPASASLILPALSPSVANATASASSLSAMAGNHQQQAGFGGGAGAGVGVGTTNGHGSNSTHLSLNAKQQRQQKRRRERAQRLQAERDSRCNSSALNGTFIAGSVGVSSGGGGGSAGGAASAAQGGLVTPVGGGGVSSASVAVMGNGSGTVAGNGNGMIYHINSAGSMGEDSNNSNGNFTSSSNGSNNLLPPTDSIASLLLNPPHSPECNSGLMATPSDSEGESLDEDLLSTSSSSTLLLPRDKPPPRPPPPVRRKLPRSPVLEEEIIDGFAILEFKTYEDLEFAIKLGQKRKEKRLSALEELTCTYSIEEMKIPKVLDTGQSSHPMRCVSSLSSTLSMVGSTTNNNSLKEASSQPANRHSSGNISSNGSVAALNSKNDSGINTNNVVYMLPSAALEAAETEPRAHWRSEYGQQQQQQQEQHQQQQQCDISGSVKSKGTVINNDVQAKNSHQIMSQSGNKQTEAAAIMETSSTDTSFLENNGHDNDSLMLDITLPPALGAAAAAADHMDVGLNVNNKSHNSIPASASAVAAAKNNDPTKTLPQLQLNNLISRDLTAGVVGVHNNHLMSVGCKAAASEQASVKKLNSLENMDIVTPSTGVAAVCRSLDVQELANGSAQVAGASGSGSNSNSSVSGSVKKGSGEQSDLLNDAPKNGGSNSSKVNNINTEKMFDIMDYPPATPMHISNNASSSQDRSVAAAAADLPHFKGMISLAGGDNNNSVTFSGVPSFSTPTPLGGVPVSVPAAAATSGLESDAAKSTTTTTTPALSEAMSSQANAAAEGESGKREPPGSILQKSTADKPLYPVGLGHAAAPTQFTSAGIMPAFGNDKNMTTVSGPSAADNDQKMAFSAAKAAATSVANGLPSGSGGMPRPMVPQSPVNVTLSNTTPPSPFTARGLAASSVILASGSSIKSSDSNFTRTNSGTETSAGGTEMAKNQSSALTTSSSSSAAASSATTAAAAATSSSAALVNGFLTGYPPATSTTVIASSSLPRASPTNSNKLMSPAVAAAAVSTAAGPTTAAGMGKMMFGSGSAVGGATAGSSPLLFPGGQPMPMLIQAPPPYRTPYANYPLFTPYSSLTTHGSYLPPVLPIVASPNIPPPPPPSHHIRSSDGGRSSSRESPAAAAAAGLMKASPSVLQNVSMAAPPPSMLRSMTPISSGSSTSQPVASAATTSSAGSFLSATNPTVAAAQHNIISHSHSMPAYGSSSSAATSGMSAAAAAAAASSPQALPPPISAQILAQPGNFSSLSHHLLSTHPSAAAAAAAAAAAQQQQQHQPIVRYSASSSGSASAAAAAASNFNSPSILTVQSLTTAVTSSSLSSLSTTSSSSSSSSVIQKIISPKGESPSNKDRDSSHSNPSMRSSHVTSTLMPVVSSQSMGMGVGSAGPFCGIASSQYGGTPVLPSNASMMTGMGMGNLSAYPSKAALWLNSTANGMVTSCAASAAPIVSSGSSTRPTPPLLNCTPGMGMGMSMGTGLAAARSSCNTISPHSSNPSAAAIGSGHVSNPSSYFPAPLLQPPQPQSSPSPAAMSATSSASQLPMVSHAMSSIVTTTTVTTPSTSASSIVQQPAVASSAATNPSAHPFSAESLFQPSKNDQADLLRRELDSRFLDRSGLSVAPPTPPSSTYLRPPDLQQQQQQQHHHHQHQHTHLHQHQQLLPPPPASTAVSTVQPNSGQIFPPPLFKDISKMSGVDPQFYRTAGGMGLPAGGGYAGYTATGLLHSGLGGPTPFMPPNHLTSFAPKKTGRWNAMHVRIAWEIYYHQNKQSSDKSGGCPPASSSLLGNNSSNVNPASSAINAPIAAGNLLSSGGGGGGGGGSVSGGANTPVNNVAAGPAVGSGGGGGVVVSNGQASASAIGIKTTPALSINTAPQHLLHRANEMPPAAAFASALPGRSPFETSPLAASFIGAPPSHIGTAVSQFGRYVTPFGFTGLTHFGGHLESWRTNAMQRSVAYHPSSALASPNWPIKSDPGLDNARREAEERERELREREQRERDRQRREREERERKEKEEKLKREHQERERERERDRKERERERREIERREMERERLLQQQRINESNKQAAAAQAAAASAAPVRDRSPHRNVGELNTEIRIKEEHPRPTKDEQDVMLMRASAAAVAVGGDPRYHQSSLAAAQANAAAVAAHHHHHANFMAASRHGLAPPPPSHLARSMMPPTLSVGGPITHFSAPAPPGWGIDPYRDPYTPILRYNPIMEAALRHEAEERQKAINIYAAQSAAHLRGKEPSPIPPPPVGVGSLGPPPPHHRLQIVSGVVQQSPQQQQQQQAQQQQQQQLQSAGKANPGPSSGAGPPPPPIVGIPVQHMISVDALSQQQQQQQQGVVNTKKEPSDHTTSMGGLVVGSAVGGGGGGGGGGLSTVVPGGVMGISPVSSVAPSR